MATVIIRPSSDYYKISGISYSTGTSAYILVDEATLDTGDYVSKTSGFLDVVFGWTDSGLSSETINKVTFYKNALCSNGETNNYLIKCDSDGSNMSLLVGFDNTSGNNYSCECTVNPLTSSAWTVSDIDNLIIGTRSQTASSKDTDILYQFYAVIDYEESAGGDDYTLTCNVGIIS